MTDWQQARDQYPAAARGGYLNTAGGAPIGRAAADAGAAYYETSRRDGDVHWDDWLQRVEEVRGQVARFVKASPESIGFTHNASAAINLAARRLEGVGGVVVVRGDFPSVTLPWMQMGYDVVHAQPDASGVASLEAIEAACDATTRILAVGWVHYRTGSRYDLAELSRFCRARDLILVVDATQALGAVALDLGDLDVDFLACSGYKWLTAGYGVGFLHVNERHLDATLHPAVGWRSARNAYALASDTLDIERPARALEMGHPPFAGVFALGAALDLLVELGPAAIEERVVGLRGRLEEVLRRHGMSTAPVAGGGAGIVYAEADDPKRLKEELAKRGVLVSARGDGLRVSVHFYNDATDLERLDEALAAAR